MQSKPTLTVCWISALYRTAFNHAYPGKSKPKHHYSQHLPLQYRRDKLIPDTAPCENKNAFIKKVVEDAFDNIDAMERHLLAAAHRNFLEMTRAQVWGAQVESNARTGTSDRWPWLTLTAGRPLVWHLQQLCGIVRELTIADGCVEATVQMCSFKKCVAPGLCFWTLTGKRQRVQLQSKAGFHACFAWKFDGEELLTVW